MLGRNVDEALRRSGPAHIWGGMLPYLRRADLLLVNLECALTRRIERWHHHGRYKEFYFRSEPEHVRSLLEAGVDVAVLANNHVMDFGVEGMRETTRVLDDAGIAHVGAGEDQTAASAPACMRVGALRVGVVAFADHPAEWAAAADRPGIALIPVGPPSLEAVSVAVAQARREADLVVASFHWGPNMRPRPSEEFQRFARSVVDAGADIFWGHSAHVVQGVEVRGGRLICYDAGDFLDDYAVDEELRNDLSALFQLRVVDGRIERLDLIPVRIDSMRVDPAVGSERSWFARRFAALCAELGTNVELGPEGLTIDAR